MYFGMVSYLILSDSSFTNEFFPVLTEFLSTAMTLQLDCFNLFLVNYKRVALLPWRSKEKFQSISS